MRPSGAMALLAAAGLLAGCGSVAPGRPPTVRYGEEACASCRMIISDERFAAALVDQGSASLRFDDIGCLIRHETDLSRPGAVYWVRDFRGHEWLKARDATFVNSTLIVSPMGFGLAAFPSTQVAEELVPDPAKRTLRFNELPRFLTDLPREAASKLLKTE